MRAERPISLGWSIGLGLAYAAVLSAIAALAFVEPGPTNNGGLGLHTVVALYGVGGIIGGGIFWVLQGLRGSAAGRTFIGFACLLPAMLAAMLMISGEYSTARRVIAAVVTSVFVGGGIGTITAGRSGRS